MERTFQVVTSGRLLQGFHREQVVEKLMALTRLDEQKVSRLLDLDKPRTIRKGLGEKEALIYRKKFAEAGLETTIIAEQKVAQEKVTNHHDTQAFSAKASPQVMESTPKMEATGQDGGEQTENVYSAPKASLTQASPLSTEWLELPRKVPASSGWKWLVSACKLFLGSPVKWIIMAIFTIAVVTILGMIPIVGPFVYQFLFVVFAGGLLMAANSQSNGDEFGIGYMFKGFTHNRNQLLMISVIYFGFFILIGLICGLLLGGGILAFGGVEGADFQNFGEILDENFLLFFLFAGGISLLIIPFVMAYWFVTPLVALTGQSAWRAYKLSFKGCLKNWLPFLVYGLAGLIISGITMAVFAGVFGGLIAISENNLMLFPFMIILWLLLGSPLMVICGLSIYTGFRDIYAVKQ